MRIALCCNHSYPHVGGSEKVVQQIAESSVNKYGHDVTVLSRSLRSRVVHNGVTYLPCSPREDLFIDQLISIRPDHTHVYSDCFLYWGPMLHACEKIPGTKSIALVGMNNMRESNRVMKVFRRKSDQISVITHSDSYLDYQECRKKGIPVNVIPNAVDLNEFDSNNSVFREPNGKIIILCVANFFPGKGQDHLIKILNKLGNHRKDFEAWMIYSDTNFGFGTILESKTRRMAEELKVNIKFIKNQKRDRVVSAFKQADVFAFPSQKEVAPLVGIESQAARTPWVSLSVGNMKELVGGRIVPPLSVDPKGYCRYSEDIYKNFAEALNEMIDQGQTLAEEGRKQVEERFSWDKVGPMYNEVFER